LIFIYIDVYIKQNIYQEMMSYTVSRAKCKHTVYIQEEKVWKLWKISKNKIL